MSGFIFDGWEMWHGFDPTDISDPSPTSNPDGDWWNTGQENQYTKLNPRSFDSDGDGLVEDDEMSVSQTTQYPGGVDPDGDGWIESDELAGGDEDPDFDRDGLWDGWEVELGFDYSWNADTDESLVAWWPMNRPGRDGDYFIWPSQDAGQDPHCTLYVMNVAAPPGTDYLDITSVGVLHRAFRNPSASYTVGSTTGTRFGTIAQESTLSVWFRMGDEEPPSPGFIAGWGQIGEPAGLRIYVQGSAVYAEIGLASLRSIQGPPVGDPVAWHHAVLRCAVEGGIQVLTLSYDGDICEDCTTSNSPPDDIVPADWFHVGGESDFEALFPGLRVDDVRIYNCALSDAQLAEFGTCPKDGDEWCWYTIGPGGGGFIKSLAVSPVNNDWVYAGSDVGGFYRSYDAGMHWQICNAGMRNTFVEAILLAPAGWSPSERVCWAATQGGLYEFDPGTPAPNWTPPVWSKKGDGGNDPPFTDLEFEPDNRIYASVGHRGTEVAEAYRGWIYRYTPQTGSVESYALIGQAGIPVDHIYGLAFDPATSRLFAATSEGLYYGSTSSFTRCDDTVTVVVRPNPEDRCEYQFNVNAIDFRDVVVDAAGTVFCTAWDKRPGGACGILFQGQCYVFRLAWTGTTYDFVLERRFAWGWDQGTVMKKVVRMAADRAEAGRVYVSYSGSGGDSGLYVRNPSNGIWGPSLVSMVDIGGLGDGYAWLYTGYRSQIGIDCYAVAAGTGGRVFGGDSMCAWRNDHAGSLKRWIPVYSRPVDWLASEPGAFDHFQGYGLDTTVVMEITPDLVEPGKLYVGYTDIALGISEDAGGAWRVLKDYEIFQTRNLGLIGDVFEVEVDPDDPLQAWFGFGHSDLLLNTGRVGGLCRTMDGGETWRLRNLTTESTCQESYPEQKACGQGRVDALLMVENDAVGGLPNTEARIVYAGMGPLSNTGTGSCFYTPSLWRSSDSGENWALLNWRGDIALDLAKNSWIGQILPHPSEPKGCILVVERRAASGEGWGGLRAFSPQQETFTDILDLTSHPAGSICGALFVPESDAHPKGFLLGTKAATRANTIADVWWTHWDAPTATWTSPARQFIWQEILGSGYKSETQARGIVYGVAADPVEPASSALAAVGYEFDDGRTTFWASVPDHYGLGVVRLRYDSKAGYQGDLDDVWQGSQLLEAARRPQPLRQARTVTCDPHRVNRVYAGTDGCGVVVGVRRPIPAP